MIESKFTYRFIYRALSIYVFSLLLFFPSYFKEVSYTNYEFSYKRLFIVMPILLIVNLFFLWLDLRKRLKIRIETNKIIVKSFFGTKEYIFNTSEIVDMKWCFVNAGFNLRGRSLSINIQEAEIFFKDGSELTLSNEEYENFDEMRSWFYNYCKENNIIVVDPLEERKKSIFKRKSRRLIKKP